MYMFSWLWWIVRKKLQHVSWQDILSCLRCTVFSSWQERWIGPQHNNLRFVKTIRAGMSILLQLHSDRGCAEWPHSVPTHTHTHWHLLRGEMTSICSHCGLPFCHILLECQFHYVQCSRCHLQVTSRNVLCSNCYCVFNFSAFVTEWMVCQVSIISCLLLSL
jgi:hypothetical protein